jgi:hypothetical protein
LPCCWPALGALPTLAIGAAQDYRIDHLDPPSWWTGMHNSKLQLMVHGPADRRPGTVAQLCRRAHRLGIAGGQPQLPVHRPGDRADAAPGKLDLTVQACAKTLRHSYPLQARAVGSAQRIGFNSSDAIYQVMPDRFANGNPANDSVTGMADKLNRAEGYGRHGGDIKGMADHLDYVAGMGFTMLWPTPLLESNMPAYSYHGYATTNLYRIDPRYGSNEEYRDFVEAGARQGHGRDPGRGAEPHRRQALVDAGHADPDWLSYRRQVRADAAPSRGGAGPVCIRAGQAQLHRRLVLGRHAGSEPGQSLPGELPDSK